MDFDFKKIQEIYNRLNDEILKSDLDKNKRADLQKKISILSDILSLNNEIDKLKIILNQTETDLLIETDFEIKSLFEKEIESIKLNLKKKERELDLIFYPEDEIDKRSAYLEIRAGTGGQEAALFVSDLLRMYLQYFLKRGWKARVEDESFTSIGGLKEVIIYVTGKNVFGELKNESGVHRVQRVPDTESAGRVHTSTVTVAVLPEADDCEIKISPNDLKIDVFRASGAGGQHVNTTDSAVRITHLPTGVVVSCQDERSQHKNKDKAMKTLKSKLLSFAIEKQKNEESESRKNQVGSGDRSEKIRTYNYPQNRVTDHRINESWKKLDLIIMGDLDDIIDLLNEYKRKNRKKLSILEF